MANFKTIIAEFKSFAENHKQLNTFYSGREWNFQAKENLYAALIVFPTSANIVKGQAEIVLTVITADLMNKDRSNKDDIISDMLEVQQDLYSIFHDSDEEIFIDEVVPAEPFEEKYDDVVAGWVSLVSVKFPFSGSVCNLPIN